MLWTRRAKVEWLLDMYVNVRCAYGATTAYCRLDNRDLIVDCSTAFCALLAMPPTTTPCRISRAGPSRA